MIKIKLQEIAQKRGIDTGYKLQKETGFTEAMAYRLWKENWSQADLKTLNTLCNVLECTPNDILVFTPDGDE